MKKIIIIILIILGIYAVINLIPQEQLVSVVDETQTQTQEQINSDQDQDIQEVSPVRTPDSEICVGEYCDGSMSGEDDFTVVNIPLISGQGDIGCGVGLIFAPHTIEPATVAVLDATYRTLFDLQELPEIESDDVRNYVAADNLLFYENVSVNNGTARLNLSGESRVYSCQIPAFRAQIEQAALQFSTVENLEVFINGEAWDWCDFSEADPSEDGCDQNPKLWVA
jgi:hypothetical protein